MCSAAEGIQPFKASLSRLTSRKGWNTRRSHGEFATMETLWCLWRKWAIHQQTKLTSSTVLTTSWLLTQVVILSVNDPLCCQSLQVWQVHLYTCTWLARRSTTLIVTTEKRWWHQLPDHLKQLWEWWVAKAPWDRWWGRTSTVGITFMVATPPG